MFGENAERRSATPISSHTAWTRPANSDSAMPSKVELPISLDYHRRLWRRAVAAFCRLEPAKNADRAGIEVSRMTTALMDTYARLPIAFSRGEGAYLYDEQGNKYLDALAGLAVTGLGHAHPRVTAAIAGQAARLMHTSNLYRVSLQETLAKRLTELAGMDRVFFGNSGAEANECAIKIARLYGHGRDIHRPHVVVMEGSFHGRTMATLTATGSRKVQAGFEPLLGGFVRAPYNDVRAVET